MKTDTVVLNLEAYNELRDFKAASIAKMTLHIVSGSFTQNILISENEAVKIIADKNKELSEEVEKLREQIKKINDPEYVCLRYLPNYKSNYNKNIQENRRKLTTTLSIIAIIISTIAIVVGFFLI